MRIGGARYQTGVAWADDLDMRPGRIQPPEAPADHPVLKTDDGEARRAAILLDLREIAQAHIGDRNLAQIDHVAEDEGEQEVERAAERLEVEIQLEGGGCRHQGSG